MAINSGVLSIEKALGDGRYLYSLKNSDEAVIAPPFSGNFGALFTGVQTYFRSDLGRTLTSTVVNALADQSGNGHNAAEATAGVGLGTVTAGLNGKPGISGGTGGQYGLFSRSRPAPGTTPTFYWGVARLLSAPSGQGWFIGDSVSTLQLLYANAGANLTVFDGGTALSVAAPVGVWGCFEAYFSNDGAANYVRFGSAVSAFGNPGNAATSATGTLFANGSGGNLGNWEFLTALITDNLPSTPTLVAARAGAQSFYTTAVGI